MSTLNDRGPALWNLLYDGVLKLHLPPGYNTWAFADDLVLSVEANTIMELENRSNSAIQLITNWGGGIKLKFNELKTKVMVVKVGRRQEVPFIFMRGIHLEIVTSFKYLGVLIDHGLKWKHHIFNIGAKAHKVHLALTRIARNLFGLKSNVCAENYKMAVEPMLLYAAQVWGPVVGSKKWALDSLSRAQRLFLLRICKGYRTISNDALCVIANICPIAIRVKELIALHGVKESGVFGMGWPIESASSVTKHPAERLVNGIVDVHGRLVPIDETLIIFTDGSKIDGKVGSAFVALRNDQIVHSCLYRLPEFCSVYQAELWAIRCALDWCDGDANIILFSDSRSSLQSILNVEKTDSLVVAIRSLLEKFVVLPKLCWVKAHAGHFGNEMVDTLAKEATVSGLNVSLPVPLSFVKKSLFECSLEDWNINWIQSTKGHCTKLFFPTVYDRGEAQHLIPNFIMTQFLSGHGKFSCYLWKFNLRPSNICVCGEIQDAHHLIFNCSAIEDLRLSTTGIDLTRPFISKESSEIFNDFVTLIHKRLVFW